MYAHSRKHATFCEECAEVQGEPGIGNQVCHLLAPDAGHAGEDSQVWVAHCLADAHDGAGAAGGSPEGPPSRLPARAQNCPVEMSCRGMPTGCLLSPDAVKMVPSQLGRAVMLSCTGRLRAVSWLGQTASCRPNTLLRLPPAPYATGTSATPCTPLAVSRAVQGWAVQPAHLQFPGPAGQPRVPARTWAIPPVVSALATTAHWHACRRLAAVRWWQLGDKSWSGGQRQQLSSVGHCPSF